MRTGNLGQSQLRGLQQEYTVDTQNRIMNYEMTDFRITISYYMCNYHNYNPIFIESGMSNGKRCWGCKNEKSTLFSQHVFFLQNINMEKEITKALD